MVEEKLKGRLMQNLPTQWGNEEEENRKMELDLLAPGGMLEEELENAMHWWKKPPNPEEN